MVLKGGTHFILISSCCTSFYLKIHERHQLRRQFNESENRSYYSEEIKGNSEENLFKTTFTVSWNKCVRNFKRFRHLNTYVELLLIYNLMFKIYLLVILV